MVDLIKGVNDNIEMKIINKIYESRDEYIKNVSEILNSNSNLLKSDLKNRISDENKSLLLNIKLVLDKTLPEQKEQILSGFKMTNDNLNILGSFHSPTNLPFRTQNLVNITFIIFINIIVMTR